MSELTKRIFESVEKYVEKENRKYAPKRINKAPEEDVVAAHFNWYELNDWYMKRYESKAKNINGVWRSSGCAPGTPDTLGSTPFGWLAAVEVKAPGRRSTLRPKQREFLIEVIRRHGFGVCSDSVAYLEKTWAHWLSLSQPARVAFLLDELP